MKDYRLYNVEAFLRRLKNLGIEIELFGNYPWIYIGKICGKSVKEKMGSDHGFVVFLGNSSTNEKETFKLIRKYLK